MDIARKQREHEKDQINKQEQRRVRLKFQTPRAVATQPDLRVTGEGTWEGWGVAVLS